MDVSRRLRASKSNIARASLIIPISMDRKGAWRDNVFVERIWKSVKDEEVYLRAYVSVSEARASIGRSWPSTSAGGLTSAWDGRRPIRTYFITLQPIPDCGINEGRNPLNGSPRTVQTNRASSHRRSADRNSAAGDQN